MPRRSVRRPATPQQPVTGRAGRTPRPGQAPRPPPPGRAGRPPLGRTSDGLGWPSTVLLGSVRALASSSSASPGRQKVRGQPCLHQHWGSVHGHDVDDPALPSPGPGGLPPLHQQALPTAFSLRWVADPAVTLHHGSVRPGGAFLRHIRRREADPVSQGWAVASTHPSGHPQMVTQPPTCSTHSLGCTACTRPALRKSLRSLSAVLAPAPLGSPGSPSA